MAISQKMTCDGPCLAATPTHCKPTMNRICANARSAIESSFRSSALRAWTAACSLPTPAPASRSCMRLPSDGVKYRPHRSFEPERLEGLAKTHVAPQVIEVGINAKIDEEVRAFSDRPLQPGEGIVGLSQRCIHGGDVQRGHVLRSTHSYQLVDQ